MKNVIFSNGLESIDLFAFAGTGLENVELPSSLRTVAQGVFAKCESLKVVKFGEGLEVLGTDQYPPKDTTFSYYYGVF